ncbi:MAG TPA: TIGR00282 family metallophosphoesterase [Firmicutes bacterium]|nr:TIGR00282 family metallophosphoesterase [Bacillota bacterium]
MKILIIGDVVGRAGRRAVKTLLPRIADLHAPDIVIANGENVAGGFGLTDETVKELFAAGVHILTTGNHVWNKKEIYEILEREPRILRPANYPPGAPGRGSGVFCSDGGVKFGVINLSGRVFMGNLDCPFRCAETLVEVLRKETNTILVDFHAEATSEKVALGWFLDGRVTAVVGTHTHVQTADERLLDHGTAYMTDLGMTGPVDSVIGVKKELVIGKFLSQMPIRFETATGRVCLSGAVIDVDESSGRARSIERVYELYDG